MPSRKSVFGLTDGLLILMAVIWGINYSAVKYGSSLIPPLTFAWFRVVGAMVFLVVVAGLQWKRWPVWRDVMGLCAIGIIGNGFYQLLFVTGVSRTRVADAALLVATVPVFVAGISHLLGIERIRPQALIGIIVSIAGVAIVIFGAARGHQSQGTLIGAMLMCAAVVCWSLSTALLQPYTLRIDPIQLNALTMVGGVLPMLFVTPFAFTNVHLATVPWTVWGTLFYSSFISIGIAYLFWYRGVRVLGPTRAAVYGNLQPVVAILFAWAALGEAPTTWQAVGAATIIVGIVLTRR